MAALTWEDRILALNPSAFWRKGEASGTVLNDETGDNDGTYINTPTLGVTGAISGDADTAVTYNGTSEYADVVGGNYTDQTSGSVEIIIKLAELGRTQYVFCVVELDAGNIVVPVRIDSTNRLSVYGSTGSENFVRGSTVLTTGVWYHIVITSSGSLWKAYINGVEETLSVVNGSNNGMWFGTDVDIDRTGIGAYIKTTPSAYFKGTIDEVIIYPQVLSAAEVAVHSYWRQYGVFGIISGNVELDGSPHSATLYAVDAVTELVAEVVTSDAGTGDYIFGAGLDYIVEGQDYYIVCDYGDATRPESHGPIVAA